MYEIIYTNRLKKSLKRCSKRGLNRNQLQEVIEILQNNGSLPQTYKPHILLGRYVGVWECHLAFDLLLLWVLDESKHTIAFIDIGTHSDIF